MNDPVRGPQRSPTLAERDERALHAYHDGELRGFARWRFERRLARSPELQRELREIAELGALLRERASEAPGPELWDRIALRLPAADARRAAAAQASAARAASRLAAAARRRRRDARGRGAGGAAVARAGGGRAGRRGALDG